MHFQSLSPWKISSSFSSSPRPARYEATLPSDTAPGPVPGKSIRGSAAGAGPLHIPPFWKGCRNSSKHGGERSGAHQGGHGRTRLAVLGWSVLPWGKGACLGLSNGAGHRAGSLAACRLPCQPCTTSFQAQCVFQQDVQFHHLLVQASGCYITDLSVCSFGFLKCACPAPLASNMLLPALCTLQIWVPPWKASTAPAIFGTEVSIFLCCSLLGSAHSSPGSLPAAHSPFLWQDFYVDHMAEP